MSLCVLKKNRRPKCLNFFNSDISIFKKLDTADKVNWTKRRRWSSNKATFHKIRWKIMDINVNIRKNKETKTFFLHKNENFLEYKEGFESRYMEYPTLLSISSVPLFNVDEKIIELAHTQIYIKGFVKFNIEPLKTLV
ncbi:hypothetical protein BpHYR1_003070 [Brachionus plicatilis]|uniref:Uncharacterized protein n=1 Tax=Brachionus plicatilis TaxID=10195 RepID=A0A3M7SED1_BRAPC|nr:hypothetical protein BpHYR1_003070 [Brachionus plicatilis]